MELPSFRLNRAECGHTVEELGVAKRRKNPSLFLARAIAFEAHAHVHRRGRDLNIEHHGVKWLKQSVDLRLHVFGGSACNFVAVDHHLEIEEALKETE